MIHGPLQEAMIIKTVGVVVTAVVIQIDVRLAVIVKAVWGIVAAIII